MTALKLNTTTGFWFTIQSVLDCSVGSIVAIAKDCAKTRLNWEYDLYRNGMRLELFKKHVTTDEYVVLLKS